MMEKMIIGRYIPVESPLHRMDPRAKLMIVFLFVCIVFLANNAITYGILAVYTFLMVFASKVPFRYIMGGLKIVFWLILFTMILHLFLTKEGDILFQWGWFTVYEGGLRQGIFISMRFFLLILMTSLLTLTTTPIEITDGLEELLGPLKKFKFPVHELALMMSISLRFIPTLMDETDKIMKAQTARGVDFSGGTIKERINSIIPLLIPLFISSFKRAEELAVAMEARGYRGGEGRTKYRLLQWSLLDTGMLILLALVTLLLAVFRM
ncbi:energy-coupling factor transporter transmembrane component T family protein [Bacillus dakarensis]|uniref:energy-coupling factor transporter transmembrane component T family protein n=1 Tax=Robertmurraya dakarensis TaxID=1926278 RepID=UPI000982296A|nr:energy-coupling factor transporter transmembrane protein EcfT [Bacillus dakarensis]